MTTTTPTRLPSEKIEPTRLPSEKIQSIAEEAAKAFSYTNDFSIERVVEELGGRIFLNDFWEDTAKTGSLLVSGLRNFEIFVPSHTTHERDRFTIAHELGHYILHYLPNVDPRVPSFRIDRYGDSAVETEANVFAYAFLMPKNQFIDTYRETKGDVTAIAAKFGVSEVVARVRARMLGLHGGRKSKAVGSTADISAA
jgi:Zn-dependent peptidase ImmA (M78 family)